MDLEYQHFDARVYLQERCPGNEFVTNDNMCIYTQQWPRSLTAIHNFFKDFHTEWDNSSASLLEFGAGPYIHTLISAAPYVDQIYHSDYLKQCRDEALMWKNKDFKAYDWSPYFKFVVNTLEGQSGTDAVAEREELLRRKLKDSLFVDMKLNNPLPAHPGSFDVIYVGYCIEGIASSLEEYKVIVQKVFNLLKPNGYLLMLAALECSWYEVNDIQYPVCHIRTEDGLIALKEAGFTLHYVESVKKKCEKGVKYYNDWKYHGCYIAQKVI